MPLVHDSLAQGNISVASAKDVHLGTVAQGRFIQVSARPSRWSRNTFSEQQALRCVDTDKKSHFV
jgi:hypothetical protein